MGNSISGCMDNPRSVEVEADGPRSLRLSDFELMRSVGRGTFGRVMLCRRLNNSAADVADRAMTTLAPTVGQPRASADKRPDDIYALKYISKSQCVKQNAVRNIINERRILERLNHPLVCNLQAAFQDADHMYILLEPMMGGDLGFHLERCGTFPEEVVKFHTIEIALAISYLHRKGIVHRDIKPANILLDERGHCHLTDFNVAGRLRKDRPMKTIAGTYNYMAPEIFQKKGYYESVDWWSLGVTMFECLYGRTPFRGKSRPEIKEAILAHTISYPKKSPKNISPESADIVNAFLTPLPRDRLGSRGHSVRHHPYFTGINWSTMERKEQSAPFQPDPALVKTDVLYQLEEVLLHEAPLQQKDGRRAIRKTRKDEDVEGSPWHSMRTKFLDFDRKTLPPSDRLVSRGLIPREKETIGEIGEEIGLGSGFNAQTLTHESRLTGFDEDDDAESEDPMLSAKLDPGNDTVIEKA